MSQRQTGSALRTSLITISTITVLLALAFTLLPKGFSGDISLIGKGSAVIVLIHNKNSVQSLELMQLMGKVRPDYKDKIEFVVVNDESQEGKVFINKQRAYSSTLLLFDSKGNQITTLNGTINENILRINLNRLR